MESTYYLLIDISGVYCLWDDG